MYTCIKAKPTNLFTFQELSNMEFCTKTEVFQSYISDAILVKVLWGKPILFNSDRQQYTLPELVFTSISAKYVSLPKNEYNWKFLFLITE